jgi:hypothetical protein
MRRISDGIKDVNGSLRRKPSIKIADVKSGSLIPCCSVI